MPRVLIIRYEGSPFAIRMSKVIRTILRAGFDCDVLIPTNGIGDVNVAEEMGWDLISKIRLYEFGRQISTYGKGLSEITGSHYFGSSEFEITLTDLLESQEYSVVFLKDTFCLERVFRSMSRSRSKNLPVVCDMYETAIPMMHDKFIRFGKWNRRLWAKLSRFFPRLQRIEQAYLQRCDHVFVVVEEASEYLEERYSLKTEKISIVHNVVDLASFDGVPGNNSIIDGNNKFLASYVGRIGEQRGLPLLLEALARLDKRHRQILDVVIVGANEDQMGQLNETCNRMELQNVKICGFLPHRDAMSWVKRSQIGVIPHLDTDFIRTTVPNKLFQYMAAGSFCIVSNIDPLQRIVRETNCGKCFEAGSSSDLANCMAQVLEDPSVIRTLGRNGRRAVEKIYQWEIESEKYTEYLNSLIS